MAVELMTKYRNGNNMAAKMEENAAEEAASGLQSVDKLIRLLYQTHPHQNSNNNQVKYQASSISTTSLDSEMDCKAAAAVAVSMFKRIISFSGRTRTHHARFRQAPVVPPLTATNIILKQYKLI
ncbi:hypothetical protein V6N13_086048 [Hibiscus sabdariffa]|uniref:Uncharacterized protein n=1 Tax=Hibiscus sabdariffa TaxID=183260 RepID=A0ABR2FSQ7_9ROSI